MPCECVESGAVISIHSPGKHMLSSVSRKRKRGSEKDASASWILHLILAESYSRYMVLKIASTAAAKYLHWPEVKKRKKKKRSVKCAELNAKKKRNCDL